MNDNYNNLANAIVLQAVKDYRKALRTLSLYPHNRLTKRQALLKHRTPLRNLGDGHRLHTVAGDEDY